MPVEELECPKSPIIYEDVHFNTSNEKTFRPIKNIQKYDHMLMLTDWSPLVPQMCLLNAKFFHLSRNSVD